jgi:hypothetical protein
MSDENSTSQFSRWVPEFHFDLIGRIIPGLLFCWLYTVGPKISDSGVTTSLAWLFCGYFTGLLLDVIGTATTLPVLNVFVAKDWFLTRQLQLGKQWSDARIWRCIAQLSPDRRFVLVKIMGERCLFRSLFSIGLIVISLKPTALPLELDQWVLGAGLTVVGLVGFVKMTYPVIDRINDGISSSQQRQAEPGAAADGGGM